MQQFLSLLVAAIAARLSSVGAALVQSMGVIFLQLETDERKIILDAKQTFHDEYARRKAAGESEIDAIEGGATAALNKFAHDEADEFHRFVGSVVTQVTYAAKKAAGLI